MITSDFLKTALVRHNYFPSQKEDSEELPSIFTTADLDDEVVSDIIALPFSRGRVCYDQIDYRATRFNNVSRPMSIPHPKPYLNLVDQLSTNWNEYNSIATNKKSVIRPKRHEDGRVIIMDYESNYQSTRNQLSGSFGSRFIVRTDIKNFYPSIYSHSIPWALVGIERAKRERDQSLWFNQIDQKVRSVKRGETNGVPIGPATSNIVSEILLSEIDEKLSEDYPHHIRYIDDYTSFHETKEEAENFVIDLEKYLAEYKLILSISKTSIVEQPVSLSDEWVSDLSTRMPTGESIDRVSAIRYLDYANQLRKNYPDGSVLKYAAKTIIKRLESNAKSTVLDYLFNTAIKFPIVIPLMETLFNETPALMTPARKQKIKVLLKEHIRYNRHDMVCWLLFFVLKYRIRLNQEIIKAVIESDDCLSKYLLLLKYNDDQFLISEIKRIANSNDKYLWDINWLLVYEGFRRDIIENPYEDGVFEILKAADVKFHYE